MESNLFGASPDPSPQTYCLAQRSRCSPSRSRCQPGRWRGCARCSCPGGPRGAYSLSACRRKAGTHNGASPDRRTEERNGRETKLNTPKGWKNSSDKRTFHLQPNMNPNCFLPIQAGVDRLYVFIYLFIFFLCSAITGHLSGFHSN